MNEQINYTPQEIFTILRINQSTWTKLDAEVEEDLIDKNDSVLDWRKRNDLYEWTELYEILNSVFDLTLSKEEWFGAALPEAKKTIWELCEFIARLAKKEIVKPVKILGRECLAASIFLGLKRDLLKRGLDVSDLRPGSLISQFTKGENLSKLVTEVSKRGVSISDSIKLKYKEDLSFWQRINVFKSDRFYVDTGEIKTFRDLTMRILESNKNNTKV